MAIVTESRKACAVNPLKMSQPLGACYAFMGMDNCMPLMHGSQGCTSFGLVLLVRHFKEAIPMQTTAMNEVSTILGGLDNIEQALLNIKKRANPALIAIASTGLTETKGDDVDAYLKLIYQKHGATLAGTEVVYVSTPDYVGAFQDGWANAVLGLVNTFAQPVAVRNPKQINLLVGCHLTSADIDELREIVESFGLSALVLPDVSGAGYYRNSPVFQVHRSSRLRAKLTRRRPGRPDAGRQAGQRKSLCRGPTRRGRQRPAFAIHWSG